jgi:hypothetical protein
MGESHLCEGGQADAYSRKTENMMMRGAKVKIFAMPSAKPRIIDSTPNL